MPPSRLRATSARGVGAHAEHQAEQRAEDDQRQRARRPMGRAFDQRRQFERQAGVDQHVERTILAVAFETSGRARAESASSAAIHRIAGPIRASRPRSGPMANGMIVTRIRKNIAPTDAPPPTRLAIRHSRRKSARAARAHAATPAPGAWPSASSVAPARPIGPWAAARMRPPPARCSAMIAANSVCAAASSAAVGSSSSQIGRWAMSRRASATRRFWPAESARTGKSAT